MTPMLASVSDKMDTSLETVIQPGKQLLHKAEEALMKLTNHGYGQIPLELVDENEALGTGDGSLDLTMPVARSEGHQCLSSTRVFA